MIRFGQQMLSVAKAKEMKWWEGIENFGGEMKKPCRVFLVKSEGKRRFGKPRCRYK